MIFISAQLNQDTKALLAQILLKRLLQSSTETPTLPTETLHNPTQQGFDPKPLKPPDQDLQGSESNALDNLSTEQIFETISG